MVTLPDVAVATTSSDASGTTPSVQVAVSFQFLVPPESEMVFKPTKTQPLPAVATELLLTQPLLVKQFQMAPVPLATEC